MANPNLETGKVEVEALSLDVLNEAQTPPFEISGDGYEVSEGMSG